MLSFAARRILVVLVLVIIIFFIQFMENAISQSTEIHSTNSTLHIRGHSPSSLCPPDMALNCTTDWLMDAFDVIKVHQGSIISKKEVKNSTEIKLCNTNYNDNQQMMMDGDYYNQMRKAAGFELPTGVVLVKCHEALIQFRLRSDPMMDGHLTCGHPEPSKEAYGGVQVHNDIDVLLATDLRWPNAFQHNLQNGFGHAAVAWNVFMGDDIVPNNLHVLTGDTKIKDFYVSLVGSERVHVTKGLGTLWFRAVYLGTVPIQITPRSSGESGQLPREAIEQVEYGTRFGNGNNAILPCSVYSWNGFQDWRENFSRRKIDQLQQSSTNSTLLYLQRTDNRYFVFSECNSDCVCKSVSEEIFLTRLRDLCQRNGFDLQVFKHSEFEIDAATFARAKVVIGPHGGAFTNVVFLNPELNPIVIETNLQQGIYDCCKSSLGLDGSPPTHFFGHLAASLGLRHVTYQPHICK